MPRLLELAMEQVGHGYRHEPWRRPPGAVAVQVTLSGCGAAWPATGRQPVLIPRGRALIFRAGVDRLVYGMPPEGGAWSFVYANLYGAAALAMAGDLIAAHGHVLAATPDHPAVRALIALDAGRERGHLRLGAARAARLACDLLLMLADAAEPERPDRLADAARAALARRLADPLAVTAAARELGVSREHLSRAFSRAHGEAPVAWLRRQRLDHAATLLADHDLPVAEVARRSGFATASHFVHAFRLVRGVTPGAYRSRL